MVVDDTPSILKTIVVLLKKEFEVVPFSSGRSALEYLKGSWVDMIIMDVEMPEMSGYETVLRLRTDHRMDTTPVLFLTSRNDAPHKLGGRSLGTVDYITKPVLPKILLHRIHAQLELCDYRRRLERFQEQTGQAKKAEADKPGKQDIEKAKTDKRNKQDKNPKTRKTIMVVDDTPAILDMMAGLLEKEFEVVLFISGTSALKYLQGAWVDMIIMDIEMPEQNGYETVIKLRADPRMDMTPVLFFTSQNDARHELAGLSLGAVDYITKPVLPEILLHRIHMQLELYDYRKRLEQFQKRTGEQIREIETDKRNKQDNDLKGTLEGFLERSRIGIETPADIRERKIILIVDDSYMILSTIEKILETEFNPVPFATADRALVYLKYHRPDLILLDVEMPEMDGFQLIEKIKADPGRMSVPVIFFTTRDDEESKLTGLSLGAADYIIKPVMPELLLRRIRLQLKLDDYRRRFLELRKMGAEI
jgi:DNA-binding response OmpR family regulator